MITAAQIRKARGLLGWSQATLAKRSGRSLRMVMRIEAIPDDMPKEAERACRAMQAAFEASGIAFSAGDGARPDARLRHPPDGA